MGRHLTGVTTTVVDVLAQARDLGFLGPGPIEAHLAHAEAFRVAVPRTPRLAVDLGSGGGAPALPLALAWPESRWLLVESMRKRAVFLSEAVEALGLADRVVVAADRAELVALAHRASADLVTARGFGSPPVTAECAAPFLRVGGWLVVSEPPGAPDRWPADGVASLGLALEESRIGPPAMVRLRQVSPCPNGIPRRVGLAAKKPRW